jgi:hypothetical protein
VNAQDSHTTLTPPGGNWKRTWRAAFPFVIITLFALPVLIPLLGDWFTCGYDNTFHLWRAVEVHNLLKQRVLYPRWAADMALGYGYPLFNFVSPLSAYVAAGMRFIGLPWVRSINFTFALGILLSGITIYLFVRDHFGRRAGLVSAVAYMYAPFQAYDAFNRGSLSEAFAWWLPPLLLWSLSRWHNRQGGAIMLTVTSTTLAALILTHNVFAFLFSPLLLGMILLPRPDSQGVLQPPHLRSLIRSALPLFLGLALTTFFWLPGLAEREWVQTQRLLGVWVFDYRNNFLSVSDLFALPRFTDPSLVNDWPPRSLGLVPALLAFVPLVGWRRFSQPQRWLVALLIAAVIGFGLMTLPVSRVLWDRLPLLPYIQFPWRFLGPAAFSAAVLAGAVVPGVSSSPRRELMVSAILIVGIFLANLGWLFPSQCLAVGDTSVAGMIRWEQATDTLGATAGGEYLPVWVKSLPDGTALLTDYADGSMIRRLDLETLPPNAEIIHAQFGPLGAEIELDTPEPFRARYLAFYYPGWRVSVDGAAVQIEPSESNGLISFDVPAGHHIVRVGFGFTTLRLAATFLSVVAVISLALAAFVLRQPTRPEQRINDRFVEWPIFAVLAIGLVVARLFIAGGGTPLRQSRLLISEDAAEPKEFVLARVDVPYAVDFGHLWMLLGHDRLPDRVASGGTIQAVLYWRALDPQGRDYAASLAVVDEMGRQWSQVGMRSPRWHRTPPPVYEWPHDHYALTAYLADLLPGTPPGGYRLVLTAFGKNDPQSPLTAYDANGIAYGPSLELGTLRVDRPLGKVEEGAVRMGRQLGAAVAGLTLEGVSLDREEARPGDAMQVTLYWRVPEGGEGVGDLRAHLGLVNEAGEEEKVWELPPVREDWPTTEWEGGDFWRGQHVMRLPGGMESGRYRWELRVSERGEEEEGPAVELGELRVEAPEREWEVPELGIELGAELGGQVRLVGAEVEPAGMVEGIEAGERVTVTLVWQGLEEMEKSYRVYVHVLGAGGEVLVQSDGEPAGWGRPTTGWAVGEVVKDERVLSLPGDAAGGEYEIVAGMYDLGTGERLPLRDGSTSVLVTPLIIKQP